MGRFSKIKQLQSKIKTEVIEKILNNQDLLKYIYYPSSDPLSEVDIENTTSLINTYVFKRNKSLTTVTDEQNFLFVRLTSPTSNGSSLFKSIYINFDIICHNSLVDNLDDGSDRSLDILDEIDEMFDGMTHDKFWVGGMLYQGFKELLLPEAYSGYRLTYMISI